MKKVDGLRGSVTDWKECFSNLAGFLLKLTQTEELVAGPVGAKEVAVF